jgi:biopolymer transport protein ExbB
VTTAELPQDPSTWGMFIHANTIVKAVMIGLAVASLVTWTVWVARAHRDIVSTSSATFPPGPWKATVANPNP